MFYLSLQGKEVNNLIGNKSPVLGNGVGSVDSLGVQDADSVSQTSSKRKAKKLNHHRKKVSANGGTGDAINASKRRVVGNICKAIK